MDRSGAVRLSLACPTAATSRCRRTVTPRGRIAARARTIGAARFAIRHGRKATARVRLSRRAQGVVRRRHRLEVVVTAPSTDAAGLTGVSTRSLQIAPAARR